MIISSASLTTGQTSQESCIKRKWDCWGVWRREQMSWILSLLFTCLLSKYIEVGLKGVD